MYHAHHSYFILRRHLGAWIPLCQTRPWESSPDVHALLTSLETLLKRSKRSLGLLITAIMGIIAIATTAAVAGMALQQTIQTTHFVQEWHENASSAWRSQTHIDEEINSRLIDLESALVCLGEEIQNVKLQLHLKCDWNITSFCVTPYLYNQTATPLWIQFFATFGA